VTPDDVLIRPATLEDRPFIANNWLCSFRGSPWAQSIWGRAPAGPKQGIGREVDERGRTYWTKYGHAGFVDDVLDHALLGLNRGGLLVACLPSDPAFAFGFLSRTGDPCLTANYLYVKKDYRQNGVGALLAAGIRLDALKIAVTAETPAWKGFAAKHGIAYEYRHPYRKER
jgi:hypothetical protein